MHQQLLSYTLMRRASVDSAENVRRREHLYRPQEEARETRGARRRRRRDRIRHAWSPVIAFHEKGAATGCGGSMCAISARALR